MKKSYDHFISSTGIEATGLSPHWGIDEAYGEGGTWFIELPYTRIQDSDELLAKLKITIDELKNETFADEIAFKRSKA